MRLIRCRIENFGRLHELDMEFDPDFQLIAEPNGWGKSTLAAFIRVMFFGFEGENKRRGTENERKRFEPWQGGVYGGQITFEAEGRTYTAVRIFGDKKANDSFELRDERTNLKSEDFSEDLGEELFRINGESFARTVFIGQNDCATYTTDSINAKIGNLTDNMNDLDCYEKASAALQGVLNKLAPRRKTGLLSRMNDEITAMQTEIRQNASLEDAIRDCTRREDEAREKLAENRRRLDEVFELSGRVSRAKDRQAKREEYNRLCAVCAQTEEESRQAEARFPGEVPSEEEIRACMRACDQMEQAAGDMRACVLLPEEEEELRELEASESEEDEETRDPEAAREQNEEQAASPDADLDEEQDESEEEEENGAEAGPEPRRKKSLMGWRILLICGIILAVAGLVIYLFFLPQLVWLIMATAGVVLIVIGRMLRLTRYKKRTEEEEALDQMQRALARERAARQEAQEREQAARQEAREREQEALERARTARLDALRQKQERFRTSRQQYEEIRTKVQGQIRQMGRTPEDPLAAQLQTIWRQRYEWETARRDAETARRNKEKFEAENDRSVLLPEEHAEDLPSMEELHAAQVQLENAADKIREQADAYGKRLADLRERADDLTATGERLSEAILERDRVQKQYDQTQLALSCLTTAKEAMTAKYMEPLMTSFTEYYGILTGEEEERGREDDGTRLTASQYRMDANTNLTVEECGMQRETEYLSRGYRDMIGLCLRLALVDAMYPDEKPFLMLDDPFVNLDEANRAGGKRLMDAVRQRYQVIYFTCREG